MKYIYLLKKYTNIVQVHPNDGISTENMAQVRNFLSGGGYYVEQAIKAHKKT